MSNEQKKGQDRPGSGPSHLAQSSRNDELLADYLGELFNTPASESLPDALHDLSKSQANELEPDKAMSVEPDKDAFPENDISLDSVGQQHIVSKPSDFGDADGFCCLFGKCSQCA